MYQDNKNNRGQTTQTGHIFHFNGPSTFSQEMIPESQLQAEFHRHTGIWAPSGARKVLEQLMTEHGFTAPKLRVAWQANNLRWDDTKFALTAKTHWFEPLAGYVAVAMMCLYFLLTSGLLLISEHNDSWRGLVAFLVSAAMFGGMLWMAVRFILMPYRVARKVQDSLKTSESHRSFNLRAVGVAASKLVPFYRQHPRK